MGDGQQLNVGPYLNIVPIVTAATSNETRPQYSDGGLVAAIAIERRADLALFTECTQPLWIQ